MGMAKLLLWGRAGPAAPSQGRKQLYPCCERVMASADSLPAHLCHSCSTNLVVSSLEKQDREMSDGVMLCRRK